MELANWLINDSVLLPRFAGADVCAVSRGRPKPRVGSALRWAGFARVAPEIADL
jgi:hypothetical protein